MYMYNLAALIELVLTLPCFALKDTVIVLLRSTRIFCGDAQLVRPVRTLITHQNARNNPTPYIGFQTPQQPKQHENHWSVLEAA